MCMHFFIFHQQKNCTLKLIKKPNLKQTCIIQKDTDIYLSVSLQIADGSDIPKKKYYEYYFLQDPPIYLQNVRVEKILMRNSNSKSDIK